MEFLRQCCGMGEIKVLFYSIWNVAYEAKERGMYKECQLMLRQLYETVKKFSSYQQEMAATAIGVGNTKRVQSGFFFGTNTKPSALLQPTGLRLTKSMPPP
jgi:hypothetical protein